MSTVEKIINQMWVVDDDEMCVRLMILLAFYLSNYVTSYIIFYLIHNYQLLLMMTVRFNDVSLIICNLFTLNKLILINYHH